jgi:serine/threonine-protein kinase
MLATVPFWSSLRRAKTAPPKEEPRTTEPPSKREATTPPLSSAVARLLAFGSPDGPSEDEALSLLASLRVSTEEGLALDGLVQRAHEEGLPGRLTLATASALIDRGDRAAARSLLAGQESTHALLLRADLSAEEGDLPLAIATIERVLLRDIDTPGATERRQRWRTRLGLEDRPREGDAATVTVATTAPRSPFRLLREVARGGAAVVYEAIDRELGRKVALKMYHRPDRDRVQLLHEARVAAALDGPGVVRVFDVDPDDGWIALEWAASGALRELLRPSGRALLPPLDAWIPELAHALARVHASGWVHHDVKPANVLIAGGGTLWLGDFGTARRRGEASPPGSLGYVSPERLSGRPSDPRDDVYGFGRVLEDAFATQDRADVTRWRDLASACVGPSDDRPADGAAVVARIARGP